MAQFITFFRPKCDTCHRRYATGELIGADRRKIGKYCNQCGERAQRKAEKAHSRRGQTN